MRLIADEGDEVDALVWEEVVVVEADEKGISTEVLLELDSMVTGGDTLEIEGIVRSESTKLSELTESDSTAGVRVCDIVSEGIGWMGKPVYDDGDGRTQSEQRVR